MKIEVIMAAYNNVEDMKFVLEAYLRQTDADFSVCVADDGSTPEIKQLVDFYAVNGLNIRHVWHEDNGFRKGEVVNKGIASSIAEFIILTDNDCIPSKWFIADYRQQADARCILIGRRVDLGAAVSSKIKSHDIDFTQLESASFLLKQSLGKNLKRAAVGMRPPPWFNKLWNKKVRYALGANMGVSRRALLDVNGFDTEIQGYGGEETELENRLIRLGLERKGVLGRCCLYHFHHKNKKFSKESLEVVNKQLASSGVRCLRGIKNIDS